MTINNIQVVPKCPGAEMSWVPMCPGAEVSGHQCNSGTSINIMFNNCSHREDGLTTARIALKTIL